MADEKRSGNPTLGEKTWNRVAGDPSLAAAEVMTVEGTLFRTGILGVLVVVAAALSWGYAETSLAVPLMIGGSLGGFVLALVICFKPGTVAWLAPLYALAEGAMLGILSAFVDAKYPGVAAQALIGTMGTLFAMLAAYKMGLLRATETFRRVVTAATLGICLMFLINLVMYFFGSGMSFLSWEDGSLLGIGVSVVIIVVAALNLILDFDFIERGAALGAPKKMEWYGAFGLMVTLVWLYIEFLRLLSKLNSRR